MAKLANVAATLHHHLCTHDWHGYTQSSGRNGDGEGVCRVAVEGKTYEVQQGDRDCSSSICEVWQQAIKGTPYEGRLDKATYTGNMHKVFVASGLFEWKPMSFIAQRGDIYLNEGQHCAMCQTPKPDMLSEFCINEKGGIVGGIVGDQTGHESHIRSYYDFPWDGILHYNGKADTEPVKDNDVDAKDVKTADQLAAEVIDGKWGNGADRRKRLEAAGYDYEAVQEAVNAKLSGKKSIDAIARDVIDGKYGNGAERRKRLSAEGYDYAQIQNRVNDLLR